MKQTILAKRYAKAIFTIGQEQGNYEQYHEVLQGLAGLFAETPEFADALTNPLYPMEVKEKVMTGIVASMGVDTVMGNFLNLLVQKKRAEILPEIADAYKTMVDEAKNISHGNVISAVELSDELKANIQTVLEKLTGKKVELSISVDPSIIGGMVAKVGDLVLDGSIKTQLAGLKDSIKGRE
ncbi:F0F1 ATP synthase subunit delta [Desulforhopalus sp. IMCC35007]|uniref:F0F1 ATP synthase subunit delta n=1 Tax=Desulforhopalus sp. IMCC35007 TaxID=2569543 RepID=UPI0010AE1671|nr:F0F1 ATP synthase subunit delta [Desulforhopalus sp. IMCC35007]TKB12194.1 F0F1 ATP synthase subunit delta [Desulforhopalus sp. IMCC35007]